MRVSVLLCFSFAFGVAALALTAGVAAVPTSLAAQHVSDSPPRFPGELDIQDSALKRRIEDFSNCVSRPPVKEAKTLDLMRKVHKLHKQIEHLSVITSTSHHPSTNTTQHPSTITSQDRTLIRSKRVLDLRKEELFRMLGGDDIIALRDSLAHDKTEQEGSDKCYKALKVVSDHLEAPLLNKVKRACLGRLNGPEERRMKAMVNRYWCLLMWAGADLDTDSDSFMQ
ncbi:hypothetical protein FA10DRAFT_277993 [Acaromyces ingoldii]|uniref:Uncharacterized protein n=1 Tax=Acaromyces ingoldii TaxID=215250 RepID=A0A316YP70_9BASI|nr:hypothetical protein FA10DRAFT_277993 [Acaromyces ingoldii]PWN91079.1 hypothetical protein FA10DRAFT_277993 [Acaromyces ingoldii]